MQRVAVYSRVGSMEQLEPQDRRIAVYLRSSTPASEADHAVQRVQERFLMGALSPEDFHLAVQSLRDTKMSSILGQLDICARYCVAHGLRVSGFYCDEVIASSTRFDQRPAGRRLLTEASEKGFHAVLVSSIDRLSRDPALVVQAIEEIQYTGLVVRSAVDGFDPESPAGRVLMTALCWVAGWHGKRDE